MTTSGLHPHNGVALTLQTNAENGLKKKKHYLQPSHEHNHLRANKGLKDEFLLETFEVPFFFFLFPFPGFNLLNFLVKAA